MHRLGRDMVRDKLRHLSLLGLPTPRLKRDCHTWWGAVVVGNNVIGADPSRALLFGRSRVRGCRLPIGIRSNRTKTTVLPVLFDAVVWFAPYEAFQSRMIYWINASSFKIQVSDWCGTGHAALDP